MMLSSNDECLHTVTAVLCKTTLATESNGFRIFKSNCICCKEIGVCAKPRLKAEAGFSQHENSSWQHTPTTVATVAAFDISSSTVATPTHSILFSVQPSLAGLCAEATTLGLKHSANFLPTCRPRRSLDAQHWQVSSVQHY